jgi:hypothetical protein
LKRVPFLPNSFRFKVVEKKRQEAIDCFIAVFHQSDDFFWLRSYRTFDFEGSPAKNNFAETIAYGMAGHVVEHVQVQHFFFLNRIVVP